MPGPSYNQQLCEMAQGGGGGLPPMPTEAPITQPQLKDYDGARCPMNAWNKDILTPQESGFYYDSLFVNHC